MDERIKTYYDHNGKEISEEEYLKLRGKNNWLLILAIALFVLSPLPLLLTFHSAGFYFMAVIIVAGMFALIARRKNRPYDDSRSLHYTSTYQNMRLRRNLWVLLGVVLAVLVVLALLSGNLISNLFLYAYQDPELYTAGEAALPGSEVDALGIRWFNGSVSVEGYDGDAILVSESSVDEQAVEYPLHTSLRDGTLQVQFSQSLGIFSVLQNMPRKDLKVLVPDQMLKELILDVNVSDVSLRDLRAEVCSLKMVAGGAVAADVQVTEFRLDSTTGNFTGDAVIFEKVTFGASDGNFVMDGTVDELSAVTMNGSVSVTSVPAPSEIAIDTVGGETILTIPIDSGFTAVFDTISGGFSGDFELTNQTVSDTETYVCGDGANNYYFSTASGSVGIYARRPQN